MWVVNFLNPSLPMVKLEADPVTNEPIGRGYQPSTRRVDFRLLRPGLNLRVGD